MFSKINIREFIKSYSIIFCVALFLTWITGGFNREISSPLSFHELIREIPIVAIFSFILTYPFSKIKKKK